MSDSGKSSDVDPIPEPAGEARTIATTRLKREQRWEEASIYRDNRRHYWQQHGHRDQAIEYSWREMIRKYPPLPPQPKPTAKGKATPEPHDPLDISTADRAVIDRLGAVEPDWDRDVLWALQVLADPSPQLDQAPSLSAWAILRWAREDVGRFMGQAAVAARKRPPAQATGDSDPEPTERETQDPGLADLERMLADA